MTLAFQARSPGSTPGIRIYLWHLFVKSKIGELKSSNKMHIRIIRTIRTINNYLKFRQELINNKMIIDKTGMAAIQNYLENVLI